ncbi:hypothetical protein [Nitrosomonas oligotropha]|uniref:hypothetical protein n=1 Tax=Nitrosomonas oligotropha TaxID=42354 RepID=UPI0013715DF2|nr:hypothetical protein [Nitrosomonas oligotropha]MXS83686.1 hypothetical protein [Nitrosomonas oligotropha]
MDRFEVLNNIEIYTDKFTETGFFPFAMQVFCWARANDLPIPEAILDAIEKGFVEWGKHDGREGKGLDDIFGLKPGCSGHTSVLTPTWTDSRASTILLRIERLIALGLNKTRATEAAYLWLCKQYRTNPEKYRWLKPNNSGRKSGDEIACDVITLNTVKKNIWEKRNSTYSKIYKEAKKDAAQSMVLWSDERKQKFLDSYLNLFSSGERTKIRISPPKSLDDCFKELVS